MVLVKNNQSFIRRFEEPAIADKGLTPRMGTQTLTEAREERDQDKSNLDILMGTQTKTSAREEGDADKSADFNYDVLPPFQDINMSPCLGTQTETRTREESDQDKSNIDILMGTGTNTDSREETDVDFHTDDVYDVLFPFQHLPITPILGTQTCTKTREEIDQDRTQTDYRIIP
jgi:hypothetical protein